MIVLSEKATRIKMKLNLVRKTELHSLYYKLQLKLKQNLFQIDRKKIFFIFSSEIHEESDFIFKIILSTISRK